MINKNRGFTLIELLVVIAIIGILASIVIANLNDAKNAAKDVAIKTTIQEGAKVAEFFFDNNGDYDLVCDDPKIAIGGIIENSIAEKGGSFSCGDTADGYCFSSTLNRGGSVCVDGYRELKHGFECMGVDDIICN